MTHPRPPFGPLLVERVRRRYDAEQDARLWIDTLIQENADLVTSKVMWQDAAHDLKDKLDEQESRLLGAEREISSEPRTT